jgi:hypothetical protein
MRDKQLKSRSHVERSDYFSLVDHHPKQMAVLLILMSVISAAVFIGILPLLESSFANYLLGEVVNDGSEVQYLIEETSEPRETSYFAYWAIDIYKDTTSEARYWVNPLLSLITPCIFVGIIFGLMISSVLPMGIGYVRQQIERIIAGFLDELTLKAFGFHSAEERKRIAEKILNADLRDLHDYELEWDSTLPDLIAMHKGLKWIGGSTGYRLLHFMDGFRIYMRFFFTQNYSNIILGLVYVGAAVLIIIIGLRGLKFIPATEPSLVFFSLGLEFSLLLLFAITIMFSKEEEETHKHQIESRPAEINGAFGSQKEAENLLSMFIKKGKDQ